MQIESQSRVDLSRQSSVESTLTKIWMNVLGIQNVASDDDFFSLGGDSLLALQIVGAAHRQGIPLTLLDLFCYPSVRAVCQEIGKNVIEAESADTPLISPIQRAKLPYSVEDAFPATKLQLGSIYESLLHRASSGVCTITREVLLPLDCDRLRDAIDFVFDRHPNLRSSFNLADYYEPLQIIHRIVPLECSFDDWSAMDAEEKQSRLDAIRIVLSRSMDPEVAPLLRFHASKTGVNSFLLSYSYHHAVLDGWSEAVLAKELLVYYRGMLNNEIPEFAKPAPFSAFVQMERSAVKSSASLAFFQDVQRSLADLDLPKPTEQQPAPPRYVDALVSLSATQNLRFKAVAAEFSVPVKSLMLAVHLASLAESRTTTAAATAVIMNGRPEVEGGDLTLGLFVNELPIGCDLTGKTWRSLAREVFDAEKALLPHRRFPHSRIRENIKAGVFEFGFNYVNFHPKDELKAAGLVTGKEILDNVVPVPLFVDAINGDHGLSFYVFADGTRFGEFVAKDLSSIISRNIQRICEDAENIVLGNDIGELS